MFDYEIHNIKVVHSVQLILGFLLKLSIKDMEIMFDYEMHNIKIVHSVQLILGFSRQLYFTNIYHILIGKF